MALVDRGQLRAIHTGSGLVLHLVGGRLEVVFVGEPLLLGARNAVDTARPAVERDMVIIDDRVLLHDGPVHVDVGRVKGAEICNGTIVGEHATAPLTTEESNAAIAEAVVHTAIEADVWPPIAGVPAVEAACERPITRGPKNADTWRPYPYARDPIVAGVARRPVARRPDETWCGQWRLNVDRKCGRCNVNGDADGDLSLRDGKYRCGNNQGRSQSDPSNCLER